MRKMGNTLQILVRISEMKKPLVRPKRRWRITVKIDFKEIFYENVVLKKLL